MSDDTKERLIIFAIFAVASFFVTFVVISYLRLNAAN